VSLPSPSVQQLSDNIIAQIAASLSQSVPFLPKAFINVLAKVLAAVVVILWKYVGFVFLQLFVQYASDGLTTVNGKVIRPLREWGRLIGVGDPLPAEQAQYSITVSVTLLTGNLPAGTALLFPPSGVYYETVAVVPLTSPTVPVTIRAVSDQSGGDGSGAIGNMQPGAQVEFANPLPNVVSKATVVAQVVAGADAEDVEVYRARIISRFQARPQGGAYADYRAWALDVPGIVHVYPYASTLPGVVDVYAEASVASSGSPDGIPTGGQLTQVLTAINLDVAGIATRRPVGAAVRALPITRTGFPVTITGLTPDTPATRAAIKSGISEYLLSREPYIEGLSVLPKNNRITEAAIAGIVDGIVDANAASVVALSLGTGPAYDLQNGEKAKLLGDPTYV
jgi:uncharacterized phage protein gp47/JayE